MEQSQPLRILQIVQGWPPEFIAGTELYSRALTAALHEQGYDCHVLAGSYALAHAPAFITTEERGISVSRYVSPLLPSWRERQLDPYNPEAEQVVRQHLQLIQPDVIHVHHWLRLTNTLVAIARDLGIPTVVTLHDLWTTCARIHRQHKHGYFCQEPPSPSMCARCVDRQSWQTEAEVEQTIAMRQQQLTEELQLASRLLVPSETHRQLLSRHLSMNPERFQVVPNCAITQLRPRLDNHSPGFPERRLRIAYWGYLVDFKGVHLILEAVHKLRDSAAVEVSLAGLAPDPPYLESLKKLASGLDVAFLGEYQPDELSQLDVDLAVFPSLAAESYGLVLDEAFQLGLPVIVSDRGALAERVGQAGLVFTAGSSEQLAQKIQDILDTPSVLETLRINPAKPSPSLAEHAQRLGAIYEEVRRQPLRKPEGGAVIVAQSARFAVRLASRNREIQSLVMTLQQEDERAKQLAAKHAQEHAQERTQLSAQLNQAQAELQKMQAAREEERRLRKAREDQVLGLENELEQEASRAQALQNALARIYRSVGWRILVRFYYLRERAVASPNSRRGRLYDFLKATMLAYSQGGISEAVKKAKDQFATKEEPGPYELWLEQNALKPEHIPYLRQEVQTWAFRPEVSIVMPVYNTEEVWLRKAVDSVRSQAYPHWQLCICNDGSDKAHIASILAEYGKLDERILVATSPTNGGISAAMNRALQLASGEFVGFLDHDDELTPDALAEVVRLLNTKPMLDFVYTDEDKLTPEGQRQEPFFKPGWSPDLLRSMNYIGHFSVIRRSIVQELKGFTEGLEGSQDYDLFLRVSEKTQHIGHIAKPVYSWRQIPGSTAGNPEAKPYAHEAGRRALQAHLDRQNIAGEVVDGIMLPFRYRVRYRVADQSLVSIIIPIRDRVELLKRCLASIEGKTSYRNYEVIIIDNGSVKQETLDYLASLRHAVVTVHESFNYSRLNNIGVTHARGDFLLFLNNDIEVIAEEWLTAMLEFAQQPGVGMVGAKLLYTNETLQHAGVVCGLGGVAGHVFGRLPADTPGYFCLPQVIRNTNAVTAACMMMPKSVWNEVGGFDEQIKVAFNDVDLCLRVRDKDYRIVYTPYALLYHLESASRKSLHPLSDEEYFRRRWESTIQAGDPYYSPHLTLKRFDCSLRILDQNSA